LICALIQLCPYSFPHSIAFHVKIGCRLIDSTNHFDVYKLQIFYIGTWVCSCALKNWLFDISNHLPKYCQFSVRQSIASIMVDCECLACSGINQNCYKKISKQGMHSLLLNYGSYFSIQGLLIPFCAVCWVNSLWHMIHCCCVMARSDSVVKVKKTVGHYGHFENLVIHLTLDVIFCFVSAYL